MTVAPDTRAALLEASPFEAYAYSYPHKTAHRPLAPPLPLADVWRDEDKTALSLYLHVPYCEMRCGFCNLFTTTGVGEAAIARYLDALRAQAEVVGEALGAARFARIAVGGGTPTLLEPAQLEGLFDLAATLGADPREAWTSVECSPKTATAERLAVLRRRGVRRVSMGVQSFDPRDTRALGRSQRPDELRAALSALKDARFDVLNLDLMYGSDGQDVARWLESLDAALDWAPDELFLYPLYVRRLTALGERMRRAQDDLRISMYRAARERLLTRGWVQVSMRRFRRPEVDAAMAAGGAPAHRCQEDGMVGLGCGARSYTDRLHYAWPYAVGRDAVRAILESYAARPREEFAFAHHGIALSRSDRVRRHALMSILQRDGLDLGRYRARFGRGALEDLPELAALIELGLLRREPERLAPTALGLERADAIGPWLYSTRVSERMEGFAWR